MNLDEAAETLGRALKLRAPRFTDDARGDFKVDKLQEFMLESAYIDGDLVEAKHFLRSFIAAQGRIWDAIDWKMAISKSRPTKQEIQDAKIALNPTLYEELRRAHRYRDGINDQIARIERDASKVSRVYTMLSS